MAKEPYFPEADGPYRSAPSSSAPIATPEKATTESARLVVTRPAPPASAPPERAEAAPLANGEEVRTLLKPLATAPLNREEVRALLNVSATLKGSPGREVWRRARTVVVPIGLLGAAARLMLGEYALAIMLCVSTASIIWTALPLLRRDDWT